MSMETLQYNTCIPMSSYMSTETPYHQSHPRPLLNAYSIQQNTNTFQYSPPSPQQLTGTSPVTDISNGLNGFRVSSPCVSSPLSVSPPKRSRVRRNLSLSMERWSTLTSPPSVPPPQEVAAPICSNDSIPTTTVFHIDEVLLPDNTEVPQQHIPTNNRSPKRPRGEIEPQEELIHMSEDAYTPLFRSASSSLLEGDTKPRSRSLLTKSDHFCSRRKESSCTLPAFTGPHPDLQYVTPKTVVELLDGKYDNVIDQYYIIDCRFPYEYEGGHIKSAVNFTENEIKQTFIDSLPTNGKKVAVIFHCEFSSQRAPRCCRFLREMDRKINIAEYPKLTYPDVYVIEGGYKNFFEKFESHCVGTYIEMRDERHFTEMKSHIRTIKRVRSLSVDHGANPNLPVAFFSKYPGLTKFGL